MRYHQIHRDSSVGVSRCHFLFCHSCQLVAPLSTVNVHVYVTGCFHLQSTCTCNTRHGAEHWLSSALDPSARSTWVRCKRFLSAVPSDLCTCVTITLCFPIANQRPCGCSGHSWCAPYELEHLCLWPSMMTWPLPVHSACAGNEASFTASCRACGPIRPLGSCLTVSQVCTRRHTEACSHRRRPRLTSLWTTCRVCSVPDGSPVFVNRTNIG